MPRRIPPGAAASLTFADVIGAFRAQARRRAMCWRTWRASPRRGVASLRPTTRRRCPDLPGYSGAARAWGMDLIDGVARWRRGEAAWRDLSAAAVLAGPPGTGKTLFAKALARACGLPIVCASMGEFFASTDGALGDVAKALSQSWDSAKACAPSVYFMDELDALPDRRLLTARGREWWSSIVALALTLFDGAATSRDGIVLIGATNHARPPRSRTRPRRPLRAHHRRPAARRRRPRRDPDDSISARRCQASTCCRSRGSGLALRRPTPPVGPATRAPSPGRRAAK